MPAITLICAQGLGAAVGRVGFITAGACVEPRPAVRSASGDDKDFRRALAARTSMRSIFSIRAMRFYKIIATLPANIALATRLLLSPRTNDILGARMRMT